MKPPRLVGRFIAIAAVLCLAYLAAGASTRWFADAYLSVEQRREPSLAGVGQPTDGSEADEPDERPATERMVTEPADDEGRRGASDRRARRPAPVRANTPRSQPRSEEAATSTQEGRRRRCASVSRQEVRARVLNPGSLSRIRIEVQERGIALSRVAGTPLTRLGLRNGDIVTTIQGRAATVDAALALLAEINRASEIRATVIRGDRRVRLCAHLIDESPLEATSR